MKKVTMKKVIVNRKFLNDLAKSIYNPTTKKFLRLCDGKLQNGPDPTNKVRPMHCGLGELYFAMTGMQPNVKRVTEQQVIDLAVKLSGLVSEAEAENRVVAAIKTLGLSPGQEDAVICALDGAYDLGDDEENFRESLDEIPGENDDGCGNACGITDFRDRSKRVAQCLINAAKYLPT